MFAANRMIFYETSIRPDVVHQTRKRIDRTGQTKKTFVYNFVGRGSVEEVVESYSEEGRNLMKELLESPQTVLNTLFGSRVELRLPGLNPKMEILEAYLDEFPLDDKVVISCEFVYSVESILAMLEERRKKLRATWTVGSLYGKTKDKSVWEEFQDNSFMKLVHCLDFVLACL